MIEIMIALVIAFLLLLGLSRIYVSSKVAFNLQNGMSRVQENARFALQYLEDHTRMVGYLGCGSDTTLSKLSTVGSLPFLNHLAACTYAATGTPKPCAIPIVQPDLDTSANFPIRFQRKIEGFEYTGASTDNAQPALGAAGDWSPALPADIAGKAVKGSDVLVLRLISEESTLVTGAFDINAGSFTVADGGFVKANGIYAITNCIGPRADIFQATSGGATPTAEAGNPLRLLDGSGSTWLGGIAQNFGADGTTLNAEVHKAEYLAVYVGLDNADSSVPALKVSQFSAGAGGWTTTASDLLDNVESLQVLYGVDEAGNGAVTNYVKANDAWFTSGGADAASIDAKWLTVVSVRLALLLRSPDAVSEDTSDVKRQTFGVADAKMMRPNDHRFRAVYDTTIALRNRLID
ncbi:MAG: PilW family protein [Rudaea sp.]|uniref:PilW family protein n=1 Tax=Rudaea sp. TaxID=2136325 RepID=UPI0039E2C4A8